MRQDLVALTSDDLITLSNRGIVKRAQQEVESRQLTFEVAEDGAGNVTVRWSDGPECLLPANKVVTDGRCSCPATTVCRHLIRSVLAYQNRVQGSGTQRVPGVQGKQVPPIRSSIPWNPGAITDEELARHFHRATLARARKQFEAGHVVELVRSSKPSARIHTLSCNLRFLVPGDPRYAHCDCAETPPCSHVPLVVWAFRLLEAERAGGLISTQLTSLPTPVPVLDEIEDAVRTLAALGISGAPGPVIDRFRRLEARCRQEGLVWPAEILAELVHQYECYTGHDARFSPWRAAELVGELCIRSDAIRSDTGAVPQLFIRGASTDQVIEVGSARLIGLGCGAQVHRGGVELAAYLQDMDSGTVVAVSRDFPDPPPDAGQAAREFWQLARTPVMKGIALSALGDGQLLIKGGKRSPSCRFIPGRAQATRNPQAFNWEALRPPVLAEDLAELTARLGALPPASLRPRRISGNLYVCAVAGVEAAEFSVEEQLVRAVLTDREGNAALLVHPYTARGREGTEALLQALAGRGETLRFVAGQVHLGGAGPVISPVSLVFQEESRRVMVQPWIERLASGGELQIEKGELQSANWGGRPDTADPVAYYPTQVMEAVGEACLLGLERMDERAARYWEELHRHGAALGFVRFLRPMGRLVETLAQKSRTVRWDPQPAAAAVLELAVLAHLAREESPANPGQERTGTA
jgi:hypothetical protein